MGDPPLGKLRGRYSLEAWGARLGIPKIGADIDRLVTLDAGDAGSAAPATSRSARRYGGFCSPTATASTPSSSNTASRRSASRSLRPACPSIPLPPSDCTSNGRTRRAELAAQLAAAISRHQLKLTAADRRAARSARLGAGEAHREDQATEDRRRAARNHPGDSIPNLPAWPNTRILGRRLAQLTNGDKAWRSHVGADGRIHGGLIHIGTPHSRAKHLDPNLAQVPNPKKGKPFGDRMPRAVPRARRLGVRRRRPGALQDRGFAHYLHRFDGGAYAKTFLSGEDTALAERRRARPHRGRHGAQQGRQSPRRDPRRRQALSLCLPLRLPAPPELGSII